MKNKQKIIRGEYFDNFASSGNKQSYTNEDLEIMQGWSLDRKIQVTQARIMEWYNRNNRKCYVSFSGGKDSTVLADITSQVCLVFNCKLVLWFSDTGLEYPELRDHVKKFPQYLKEKYNIEVELIMDYPKDRSGKRIIFKDVILNEGYPILSKNISRQIGDVQKLGQDCWAARCFDGRETGMYDMRRWKYVLSAPFKVSNKCCEIMKKRPAHSFTKKTGLVPIIGTMAYESRQRKIEWLHNGCNEFNAKYPSSKPISFWTEQDVLEYIVKYDIPYSSVYGEIVQDNKGNYYTTGLDRTGCIFCGFGCHLEQEPNRFQRLKQTHPKLWKYCMKSVEDGGLGMMEVLEYIGVKVE